MDYADFDDRRITIGRSTLKVYQGGANDEYAFVDGSKRIYTDPRLDFHATIGAVDPPISRRREASPYIGVPSWGKYCAWCGCLCAVFSFRTDPDAFDGLAAWCCTCERRMQKQAIKRGIEAYPLERQQLEEQAASVPTVEERYTAPVPVIITPPAPPTASDFKAQRAAWGRRKARGGHFVRAFA